MSKRGRLGRRGKQQEIYEKNHLKIEQILKELMLENEGATQTKLSKKAKLSRPTIYKHLRDFINLKQVTPQRRVYYWGEVHLWSQSNKSLRSQMKDLERMRPKILDENLNNVPKEVVKTLEAHIINYETIVIRKSVNWCLDLFGKWLWFNDYKKAAKDFETIKPNILNSVK